jgi:DNA-binding transcriptional regulator YiaG
MKETDLKWLAGLLEGEGSFLKPPPSSPNCPRISLEMTDKDVVEKAALLMGGRASTRTNLKSLLWKPTYRVLIRGSRAAHLMRILYPEMGMRRRSQIDAALKDYIERKKGDNTRRLSEDQIRLIRKRQQSTISALAREFGVSRPTIRSIRERKTWVNLDEVS